MDSECTMGPGPARIHPIIPSAFAGFAISLFLSTAMHWFDGRTNGACPVIYVWLLCGLAWLFLTAYLIIQLIRAMSSSKRLAWLVIALVIAVLPLSVLGRQRDTFGAFLQGFSQWAASNKALSAFAGRVLASDRVGDPLPAPDWWPTAEREAPLGVRLQPDHLPANIQELKADEIRFVQTGVLFSWKSGWLLRFALVCPEDCAPPLELLTPNITWNRIRSGLWIGVVASH